MKLLRRWFRTWGQALLFSYRYDQPHGFATTLPFPVAHVFNGHIVPCVHFTGFSNGSRRYGLDYLYTPSTAHYLEWCAAGGIEWFRTGPARPFKVAPAAEVGLKVRAMIP